MGTTPEKNTRLFITSNNLNYPDNTAGKFRVHIPDGKQWNWVNKKEDTLIEIGLKHIFLKTSDISYNDHWVVKSSLVSSTQNPNSILDVFFTRKDVKGGGTSIHFETNSVQIDFHQPTYHTIRWRELIDRIINFEIWNLKDKILLESNTPVRICLNVRAVSCIKKEMETIRIYAQSDDTGTYPENRNDHFSILLPKRLKGKGGRVWLDAISIPRFIENIHHRNCRLSVELTDTTKFDLGKINKWENGVKGLIEQLNNKLGQIGLQADVSTNGKIRFSKIVKNRNYGKFKFLHLTKDLSLILGFEGDEKVNLYGQNITVGREMINLEAGSSKTDYLFVTLNIVKPTLFWGNEYIRYVKLLPLSYEVNSQSDEKVFWFTGKERFEIEAENLERLEIQIVQEGERIKPVSFINKNIPTRIWLGIEATPEYRKS